MRRWRPELLIAAMLIALAACGGGGDSSRKDPVKSSVTSNFVADSSPACPGSADGLSLRKVSALGASLDVGLQVTDCDGSLGIYGVNFEISFDTTVVECTSSNPCSAGTVLGSPLLTSQPECTCNNSTGQILGTFSKKAPGTNDTVGNGGNEDIVELSLRVKSSGLGRMDFVSTDNINGTALVTLSGGTPVAITGMTYIGGSAVGQ